MVGSLTGAVSSQKVTEEYEGLLGTVGHRTDSAMAKEGLTARLTRRAGAKAGHSDPVVLYGRAIAQRIKGRLNATRTAFARLRYFLGGDRPSQTAHQALSSFRITEAS